MAQTHVYISKKTQNDGDSLVLSLRASFREPVPTNEYPQFASISAISRAIMERSRTAYGKPDIRKVISEEVAKGSPIGKKDGYGYAPFHYAADLGDLEAAIALREAGADIYATNSKGETPAQLARRGKSPGHTAVLNYLLGQRDSAHGTTGSGAFGPKRG